MTADPKNYFMVYILQEVILMRDSEDPSKFYPRFGLDRTASFEELDDHRYEFELYCSSWSLCARWLTSLVCFGNYFFGIIFT